MHDTDIRHQNQNVNHNPILRGEHFLNNSSGWWISKTNILDLLLEEMVKFKSKIDVYRREIADILPSWINIVYFANSCETLNVCLKIFSAEWGRISIGIPNDKKICGAPLSKCIVLCFKNWRNVLKAYTPEGSLPLEHVLTPSAIIASLKAL